MPNIWERIKIFFSELWNGLSRLAKIILGLLLLAIIIMVVVAVVRENNKKQDQNNSGNTEVTQVYEPSISSPIPPDVIAGGSTDKPADGNVAGDSTNNSSQTTTPATTPPPTRTPEQNQAALIAPPTGVDPKAPVAYSNSQLSFKATLPPGSNVEEQGNRISFKDDANRLLYFVSAQSAGSETLESITDQLRNSPSVSQLLSTNFTGYQALKFTSKEYGNGIVLIANGNIYYMFGNGSYFNTFRFN